jgi:hypothetical protein
MLGMDPTRQDSVPNKIVKTTTSFPHLPYADANNLVI